MIDLRLPGGGAIPVRVVIGDGARPRAVLRIGGEWERTGAFQLATEVEFPLPLTAHLRWRGRRP